MFRENNKKIFNFINPNSNDILIDFDSKDLRELFIKSYILNTIIDQQIYDKSQKA